MIFAHTKICSECHKECPATLEYFHKDKRIFSGLKAACKMCSNKRLVQFRKDNPERAREYTQNYTVNRREELSRKSAEWTKRNPKKKAEQNKRYTQRYPEKRIAHTAVNHAIRASKLKPPSDFDCSHKGSRCKGQAKEYHHHKGYSVSHRLDVIPVCAVCHRSLDKR